MLNKATLDNSTSRRQKEQEAALINSANAENSRLHAPTLAAGWPAEPRKIHIAYFFWLRRIPSCRSLSSREIRRGAASSFHRCTADSSAFACADVGVVGVGDSEHPSFVLFCALEAESFGLFFGGTGTTESLSLMIGQISGLIKSVVARPPFGVEMRLGNEGNALGDIPFSERISHSHSLQKRIRRACSRLPKLRRECHNL